MNLKSWRLRTQIAILVTVVVSAAQALGFWFFVDERSLAVQAAIAAEAAGRAANVAKSLEGTPPNIHDQIINAATSPLVRFDLSDAPKVKHEHGDDGASVKARIRALLDDSFSRDVRVEVHEIEQGLLPLPNLSPEMADLHVEMMQGDLAAIEMEVSILLAGGHWLNMGTRFERPPIQWSWVSSISFAFISSLVLVTVFWIILTRLTGPLKTLAEASDRLGRGAGDGALPIVGPQELRDLTQSFNTMQDRLTRFVADRTQMLAALAHDLRSPLTVLRVRAEMVEDDETRLSLVASGQEMQQMVDATLDFAKGVGQYEDVLLVDIQVILAHIARSELTITQGPSIEIMVKPGAMRRAFRNLSDNAIRYGKHATISWATVGDELHVCIDDDGPGIPDAMLETVFKPYERLEASRSRDTGGHGLGLSIARSIVFEHGGTIVLSNRNCGGLCAKVVLPIHARSIENGLSEQFKNGQVDENKSAGGSNE